MIKIKDISVTTARKNGEHRKSGMYLGPKPKPISYIKFNPILDIKGHHWHAGYVYRKAIGDFQTKGQAHGHPDQF